MTIEMQNNLQADGSVNPPAKSDGSLYRFCMYFDNSKSIVFSDEPAKLLARLIPGYEALDMQSRKGERFSLLETISRSLDSNIEILDYDLPEDPNSIGFASEEATLRSLHKLGFISLFSA
jgi:hypothetical protein